MEKYIDKDALVAEIKERIETYKKGYANGDDRRADALEVLLHDIDTLEVKEVDTEQLDKLLNWWKEVTSDYSSYKAKEMDLEKEVELWMQGKPNTNFEWGNVVDAMRDCAKHFFELGIAVSNKVQKGK